jgi:hypothetical protein
MQKIRTSHLIYFFIIMFPLSNFLLPFLIYGDEINIRIYQEGSFGASDTITNEANTFPDNGKYTIGPPQGNVHKIDPESIYTSILYVLIFFLTSFFIFAFRNKYLNYDVNFLENKKKEYFQILSLFFIVILTINYFKLTNVSNLFENLILISKIFFLFISCTLMFTSKNKKELALFMILVILAFLYIIEVRSKSNLPISYKLIFYFYFLSFIVSIFLNLKNKLTFINVTIITIVGIIFIITSFMWKENLRSYSDYNWNKLSQKIYIYNVNKAFKSNNVIYSVITAPISRINKLDQLSYIVETKKNHELFYGETYIPLFTKFIPRQLWKDKPTEIFGNKYGRYYNLIPSYDKNTSVGASTIIEAYINFRFLGIIFLAIFYGLVYRILNFYIHKNREKNTYLSFLLISISIFISLTSESNLSSGLGGALQLIFIAIIYNSLSKFVKIDKKNET